MKKTVVSICCVFLISTALSASGGKVILNLYGNCLNMPSNSFTGQTSQYKMFFEAKAALAVSGNFYLWASHGYFPLRDSWDDWSSKNAFAADTNVERTLAKRVMAAGLGYFIGYFEENQFALRLEGGICSIANAIDSTIHDIDSGAFISSESARQSGIGARADLAVTYGFYKHVFMEVEAGYMYAADTIAGVRSSLGGFHLALGLGIQL